MASSNIPAEVIAAYSEIDVSCIADVLAGQRLNCVVEGIFPVGGHRHVPRARAADGKAFPILCGPAVTMRQIATQELGVDAVRHQQVLLEVCEPGDVLVVEMGGRMDCCGWGGNMNADAKNRGIGGVVIDGTVRDTEPLTESGVPIFCRGVSNRHTHGLYYSCCINNEPIQIGTMPYQVMVKPGDLLVGDVDGLVVVPHEKAVELLPLVQERHDADLKMWDLITAGKGHDTPEVEELLAEVRDLEGVTQTEGYKL